jgi:hypothetical protein
MVEEKSAGYALVLRYARAASHEHQHALIARLARTLAERGTQLVEPPRRTRVTAKTYDDEMREVFDDAIYLPWREQLELIAEIVEPPKRAPGLPERRPATEDEAYSLFCATPWGGSSEIQQYVSALEFDAATIAHVMYSLSTSHQSPVEMTTASSNIRWIDALERQYGR